MNNRLNGKLGSLVATGGGKIHTGLFGSQLHASDYVHQGIPCNHFSIRGLIGALHLQCSALAAQLTR